MRADRELMRGAGPVAVLKLLSRGEMYGYELVQALAETADGVLDMGQSTLYPLLYNLESKGLVKTHWKDAPTGRRRKYYGLTARGKKRLSADLEQWRNVVQALTSIGVLEPARGGKG